MGILCWLFDHKSKWVEGGSKCVRCGHTEVGNFKKCGHCREGIACIRFMGEACSLCDHSEDF